jgi:23S rRNA (adenine2030-N6)-methyltransferase
VAHEDGLKGMAALLPPTSRRGLVLIDPSYEVKSDYDQVIECMVKGHKKFSSGMYAIWYPVVERRRIEHMERKLTLSGIRNIQRFELGLSADAQGRGMNAAGMFVVNPPWKLFEKMTQVLPRLAQAIGESTGSSYGRFYRCDVLVKE